MTIARHMLTADVLIVGAGITGLHCAAELERLLPSARVLVVEADETLGGRIRSAPIVADGRETHVDLGAHYFGARHRRVAALADRLAPGERIDHPASFGDDPGCRARLAGRWQVTTRSSAFFDIPGLTRDCPPSDAITILRSVALFCALEKLVDVERPWDTPFAKELDAISFQEWIDDQSLPHWIVQMWQTSSLGIASVHARDVSLLWWLWYNASNLGLLSTGNDYAGGPQQYSVVGGLGTLVHRYARTLRSEIRLRTPIVSIDHGAPDHVRATTRAGDVLTARHVVVAVTPHAVGRNIAFTPSLSPRRQELVSQRMGHAIKAVLQYREPWWWNAHGGVHFNAFFTAPEDSGIEWAIDTSSPRHGHCSLMAFVSDRLVDRAGSDPAALRREVLEGAVELTGDPRARDVSGLAIYDWRANPWVGGGPNTAMRPGLLSRLDGVMGTPEGPHAHLHFASSEQSSEFTGYVEGGLACAERTAERIREALAAERAGREPRMITPLPREPLRSTDALGTLALGAGYAAMTPLYLARPVIDGAWRLLRR